MIEIKGTKISNIECYLLSIRKKSFLFFSKPNLSHLRHFVNLSKTIEKKEGDPNQIIEEANLSQKGISNDFSKLKVHLDINYIKQICKTVQKQSDQTILHLMITHYQDFLIIPYIYRKFKGQREIKIFCTHIAYEMGRIYLKRFFDRVFHFDLIHSDHQGLTYEEESKLQDQFYIQYGVEIKTWVKLFSKQQMNQCLKFANKMNYGQIYDSDGVKIRPFSSGHSLGSCFWMFENTLTKQTVMFVRDISSQSWRCILQNHLAPSEKQTGFKQKDFQNVDLLILANNTELTPQHEKPEMSIIKLMKEISAGIEKGVNTEVVFEDELIILDIIDYISFEMKDQFRGIFVQNSEFNQIVSYANSYVEFLSAQYKNKIYQDPPQYPFQNYLILKQKGFLSAGSLYEICDKQKIPLKQLMRKSSPYIHFKSDFQAYLSELKDEEIKVYKEKCYLSAQNLSAIFSNVNPKKIVSYTNIPPQLDTKFLQNTALLTYGKQFVINSDPHHHYISKNISPNIINKYEFVEGFLMAYPVNREFLRFNSNWKEEILRHLKNNFIPVLQINETGLKTKNSHIWIQDYQIFVKSSLLREVQFVLQIISQITKTLKLK